MNNSSDAFVKGGLGGWAALFLVEVVLFQVNGTLPISAIPTISVFILGGCIGLVVRNLFQSSPTKTVSASTDHVELLQSHCLEQSYRDSYEEWKRF